MNNRLKELVDSHTNYVMSNLARVYREAFEHGYKHGKEDAINSLFPPRDKNLCSHVCDVDNDCGEFCQLKAGHEGEWHHHSIDYSGYHEWNY